MEFCHYTATTFVNNSNAQDWYGFFHGHDYKGALERALEEQLRHLE